MNMAAFGEEFGVSRETVRKWKGAGMPVDGRDGAIAWLAENRPKYLERIASDVVDAGAGAPPDGGEGDLDGLGVYSVLSRYRDIALRAWRDLDGMLHQRAEASGLGKKTAELDAAISRLDKRYKAASEDRMAMEKRVADFDLETGRRVSMERVKEFINEKFAGLKVQIEALPHTEARNCNPDDPETAKRELLRAIGNILRHEAAEEPDA